MWQPRVIIIHIHPEIPLNPSRLPIDYRPAVIPEPNEGGLDEVKYRVMFSLSHLDNFFLLLFFLLLLSLLHYRSTLLDSLFAVS